MTCPSGRALATFVAAALVALAPAAARPSPTPAEADSSVGSMREVSPAVDGPVRIVLAFRRAAGGTFVASGELSDRGSFTASRRVGAGRLQLTEVLTGKRGTIRVRATRPCRPGAGAWTVLSGTGEYQGLKGSGATSLGPRCTGTTYPVRAIYTGSVRTPSAPPLPALADPGRYGGGTAQREEVTFDVEPGGLTLANLRLRVQATCQGTTFTTSASFTLPGPYEIARDGSFSIETQAGPSTRRVTGRFVSRTAVQGTASVATTLTVGIPGTTYPCAATVTWAASQPPPAAVPGKYCGFTLQGPGVCLDVAPSGREVAQFEVGVVVRCQVTHEFELALLFTGIPIGGHLGFTARATSFEGLAAGSGSVSGTLEPDGSAASGSVSLVQAAFDHEGTRYTCRNASARWTAKRQ